MRSVSLALGQGLGISDIGRIALEIVQDVLDRTTQHLLVGFLGHKADMRRTDDIVELQEGIVGVDGFSLEHIQASPSDAPVAEGIDERRLIDDGAASGIDQVRGRFHQSQLASADELVAAFG